VCWLVVLKEFSSNMKTRKKKISCIIFESQCLKVTNPRMQLVSAKKEGTLLKFFDDLVISLICGPSVVFCLTYQSTFQSVCTWIDYIIKDHCTEPTGLILLKIMKVACTCIFTHRYYLFPITIFHMSHTAYSIQQSLSAEPHLKALY
jgi:hypothetical protein